MTAKSILKILLSALPCDQCQSKSGFSDDEALMAPLNYLIYLSEWRSPSTDDDFGTSGADE